MNKLLILLLLSTPLFAQDFDPYAPAVPHPDSEVEAEIAIEDKVLANLEIEVIFMSNGNYAQEIKFRNEVKKGVWERYSEKQPNIIEIYLGYGKCRYIIKKIADTYIFEKRLTYNEQETVGCSAQLLLQETEWSKTNLPQKLDEYKNRTD
jgi:antitoxin component YwqK of YwqJK toxin-antitoxin module|tara:strand:- start:47 stop:496 length:450 start_codon:yes stop_codon:yes gene_type:complete